MFVRRLRNRSGSVSVQIISKKYGRYQVVKTVGTAKDPNEIEQLVHKAKQHILYPSEQLSLVSVFSQEDIAIRTFLRTSSGLRVRTIGPELIFGTLFDRMRFNVIPNELFRHLVIARLAYPTSKLKTVDYLRRYQGRHVSVQTIYRFLDELHSRYKEQIEAIAYEQKNASKISLSSSTT